MSYHYYRPSEGHGLAHDPFNAIIAPRPIGWIASRSGAGVLNLAPYSFFNAFNYTPPIIGFSSTGRKDSLRNIEETGEFTWNLATQFLADQMNMSSAAVSPDVDEFALSELTPLASHEINVPRVAESPVSMECRLIEVVQLKTASGVPLDTWLVLGEVIGVHIDDSLIENGIYKTVAGNPLMRGGGAGDYFTVNNDTKFVMMRPQPPSSS